MREYLARRILQMIPLLLGISIVSFAIIHIAPGDPATLLINPQISQADIERLRHQLGLDRPLPVQYWLWLVGLLHGDFGRSFTTGQPVLAMILERVPRTFEIVGLGLLIQVIVAVAVGTTAALRQYSAYDHAVMVTLFGLLSIPNFWFGLMLILVFGVQLRWFPFLGLHSFGKSTLGDHLMHLVLPLTILGLHASAGLTRYVRAAVLEVRHQDYIRTGRAKGLAESVVVWRHMLKNALIPLITLLGLSLPDLFGGAFIVENLFAIPGIGRLSVESVFRRDYTVVMGVNMIAATLVVLGNLIADILYAVVDPRVKYS